MSAGDTRPLASIEARDMRFDFSDVPMDWHGGSRAVSLFFGALAVCFPVGERFFVRSVKAFRDRIEDPRLREDVSAFCQQEGHHGREHDRYNDMMRRQGLPVDAVERRAARMLALAQRLSPLRQLAATAALEHFTAMLGVLVLQDPNSMTGAHPTMAALWRWHSAEENEHKAVAFDVYKAVGGTNRMRAWVMFTITITFWLQTVIAFLSFMRAAGILWNVKEHLALARYLFGGEGGLQTILRPYLRYYAPSFHPNEIDSRPLFEEWRAALG